MKARQAGFTVIELMFTVIVLAVLLGIGVPNFRDFVRNSRMTSSANDFMADVSLARSEAVKRRQPVLLCSSADPMAADPDCVDPDDPPAFTGWIVFVDDLNPLVDDATDNNQVHDAGEEVLRRYVLPTSITTVSDPAGLIDPDGSRIVFGASGFVRPGVTGTLNALLLCDDRGTAITVGGNSAARGIDIPVTGRARITRVKTEIEADFGTCP